jgi:hypothetical protein
LRSQVVPSDSTTELKNDIEKMLFDPDNHVVKLCAQAMDAEGTEEALRLFEQAWSESTNDEEKFIAAHYLARQQNTTVEKLKWDETALHHALQVNDDRIKETLSSLYLNIGKCHENLHDDANAKKYYELAQCYAEYLSDDGYGAHIRRGIERGIERVRG